jgi:CHAD domain-containing protein
VADGKWIPDLHPTTPLIEAARRVLEVRLQVVHDHLPPVLTEADRDPEHVHQLRVATRRADAALRIFADCLSRKVYKSARRQLRGLRRAAGAARDWDVFRLALVERGRKAEDRERAGLDFLLGHAGGQRAAAQVCLEASAREQLPHFARLRAETLEALRPAENEAATLLDLARPLLAGLHGELEQAVAGDLKDYSQLHQVRITGKRLRYAMEVFADCFEPAFREQLYPRIEAMQEILGKANDSHVAGLRMASLRGQLKVVLPRDWPRFQPAVEGLLRSHQRRLRRERRAFLRWWSAWQENGEPALQSLAGRAVAQST